MERHILKWLGEKAGVNGRARVTGLLFAGGVLGLVFLLVIIPGCSTQSGRVAPGDEATVKKIAGEVIASNGISDVILEGIRVREFQLDAPGRKVLGGECPDLEKFLNRTVIEAAYTGTTGEKEYRVILDPGDLSIICAFGIDRRAAPGIIPLKIERR